MFVIVRLYVCSCVSVWLSYVCVLFVMYRGVLHGLCLDVWCVVCLCAFKVCLCVLIGLCGVMLRGLSYVCFVCELVCAGVWLDLSTCLCVCSWFIV